MSTKGVIGVRGLKTSGNELTFEPGSLKVASEVFMPSRGVVMTRRGEALSTYIDNDSTDATSNRARELWQWGDHLLIHYAVNADGAWTGNKVALWENWASDSPTYHLLGSYAAPAPSILRMKFAAMGNSAYWTTDAGLATVDSASGTARAAGIKAPEAIYTSNGGHASLTNATGSWMPTNCQVAVRACIGLKDTNGVVRLSAPSGRLVIGNPKDILVTTGHLVRTSNVVTATIATGGSSATSHTFQVGQYVSLSTTDGGNFNQTDNLITAVTSTTITWAETAANYTSTVDVTISSGTKYIAYGTVLPSGLTTSHFVQIYRTDESATDTTDPGDECFQVYERYLTSTDISNGSIVITDKTPSGRAGAPLVTNANSGDGILNGSNLPPPLCRDICVWDGRLFGGATTDSHRLYFRMLGTGSPDGLQSGDVICFNKVAQIAGTDFTLYTQFTPTLNVLNTLRAMSTSTLTFNTTGQVLRMLMSGDSDETWGAMSLEEDGVGGSALYAGTSRPNAFAEPLSTVVAVTEASSSRLANVVTITTATSHGFATGDTIMLAANALAGEAAFATGLKTPITVTGATTFAYAETGSNATMSGTPAYFVYKASFKSDNNQQPLRCSKPGQPEAWPLSFSIGGLPDRADVLRIKPTPDGGELMVCLRNGDVYAVSGQYPYSVRRVDGSASLLAADSLQEHANRLYGLTTQGVCAIGSSGVAAGPGVDIEGDVRDVNRFIMTGGTYWSTPFGVSYESDRTYQLWLPGANYSYNYCDTARWLNTLDGSWASRSTSTQLRSCGLVFKGTDLLVYGDGSSNRLRVERKSVSTGAGYQNDRADGAYSITVNGTQNNVSAITVTAGAWSTYVGAGAAVSIGGTYYRVTAATSTTLTISGTVSVTNGQTLTGYTAIASSVTFALDSAGIPGVDKLYREVQLHLGPSQYYSFTVTFSNEKTNASTSPVTITDSTFTYGNTAYVPKTTTVRVEVPQAMQRCAQLTINVALTGAFQYLTLLGYSATSEPTSERTGR